MVAPNTHGQFTIATRWLGIVGLVLSLCMLAWFPIAVLFVTAVMFGYSEINGACGVSHIGTLTPLRSRSRPLWIKAVLAYTLCGALTASCVGAVLAHVGAAIGIHAHPTTTAIVILVLAIVFLAREIGWIKFSLPQIHRQTTKMWADQFGLVIAGGMWGAHIGLAFFTVVKHGGFYVIVAIALAFQPPLSATIFLLYWLGRTLPIWAAPMLFGEPHNGRTIMFEVISAESNLRYLSVAGLLATTCAIAIMVGSA